MRKSVCCLFILLCFISSKSYGDASREFLLSCTYGVLAGALVGAASLAVEDEPGDKVHRIARGASLGLYAGILLGAYVAYGVPSQTGTGDEQQDLENIENIEPDDYGVSGKYYPPRLTVYPVIEENRITGAAMSLNVARF